MMDVSRKQWLLNRVHYYQQMSYKLNISLAKNQHQPYKSINHISQDRAAEIKTLKCRKPVSGWGKQEVLNCYWEPRRKAFISKRGSYQWTDNWPFCIWPEHDLIISLRLEQNSHLHIERYMERRREKINIFLLSVLVIKYLVIKNNWVTLTCLGASGTLSQSNMPRHVKHHYLTHPCMSNW